MARQPKEQFCWYCGEFLGVYAKDPLDLDTCGAPACNREARSAAIEEDRGEFGGNTGDGWSA